jgi:hypothetical protein
VNAWPAAADEPAPDLVGTPDDQGEGSDGGELGAGQRGRPEEALQRGCVDHERREHERDGDPAQQRLVAEEADLAQRRPVGADRERGADLAGDDAEPGDGGGLPVPEVQN